MFNTTDFGTHTIMVQFLISLIEWFAVMALSSIGIEASQTTECSSGAAPQPAEYREAVLVIGEGGTGDWQSIRLDPCAQWSPIRDNKAVPELLSPPLVYNS